MANYLIIGGDQKEYGPITADDVRKWIAEDRLNAQSMMKAESDAGWRPLSAFPEFADALGGKIPPSFSPPPFNAGGSDGRATALQLVKSPATGLKVTAILNIILAVWGLVKLTILHSNMQQMFSGMQEFNDPQVQNLMRMVYGPLGIASYLFALAMSALVLIGASKMQSLRSFEFAFAAAILAIVPCLTPCCILGLPFGIWALAVLNKPEVKSQFN